MEAQLKAIFMASQADPNAVLRVAASLATCTDIETQCVEHGMLLACALELLDYSYYMSVRDAACAARSNVHHTVAGQQPECGALLMVS